MANNIDVVDVELKQLVCAAAMEGSVLGGENIVHSDSVAVEIRTYVHD